jgi:hypothetical protein
MANIQMVKTRKPRNKQQQRLLDLQFLSVATRYRKRTIHRFSTSGKTRFLPNYITQRLYYSLFRSQCQLTGRYHYYYLGRFIILSNRASFSIPYARPTHHLSDRLLVRPDTILNPSVELILLATCFSDIFIQQT